MTIPGQPVWLCSLIVPRSEQNLTAFAPKAKSQHGLTGQSL